MSSFSVLRTMHRGLLAPRQCLRTILNTRAFCAAQDTKPDSAAKAAPTPEEAAELGKQIEELTKNFADLKDKYQRALADRENVRLRLEKQVADAKIYAVQGFCKDLLEVSDVFSKALGSVSEEHLQGGPEQFRALYDGVTMTQTQLHNVFRRHGLVPVELKEGDSFDPALHEAMFEVPPQETREGGQVVHILRQGWKLHDRCLRSAQVGVVKGD